jgi:uncharacterized membrane protein YeaQ/YmgE (transglycosylase-associated protein family)
MDIVSLIIQLIAGAVGGNVGGAVMKNYSLGTLGNTIAGAVGGVAGGSALGPMISMPPMAGGFDIGNTAVAAIAGLIVQIVAGLIKANMAKTA